MYDYEGLLSTHTNKLKTDQKLVEGKILAILGKDTRERIFARKCQVRPIAKQAKQEFFDEYHIQGSGPGSTSYGLFYRDELVAAMTLIEQKDQWVLNRYATKHHVVGGFGKLLNHFMSNHSWSTITSFADLRWSNGNVYNETGWKLEPAST